MPLLSAILKSHDKIAQPDWLTLLVIHGDECRESQKWAHLAIGGEFNHQYLTCQISAILYANHGDRHIKSPSVSLALGWLEYRRLQKTNSYL